MRWDVQVDDGDVLAGDVCFDENRFGDAVVEWSWNLDVIERVVNQREQSPTATSRPVKADGSVAGESGGSCGGAKLGFLQTHDFDLTPGDEVGKLSGRVADAITVPADDGRRGRMGTRVGVDVADEEKDEETLKSEERGEAVKTRRKREMPTRVPGRRRRLRHPFQKGEIRRWEN